MRAGSPNGSREARPSAAAAAAAALGQGEPRYARQESRAAGSRISGGGGEARRGLAAAAPLSSAEASPPHPAWWATSGPAAERPRPPPPSREKPQPACRGRRREPLVGGPEPGRTQASLRETTMILLSSRSALLSVYYPQIFLILTSGSYL